MGRGKGGRVGRGKGGRVGRGKQEYPWSLQDQETTLRTKPELR